MLSVASLNLDVWQRDILSYDGNVLLCTGRQVGKSTILGIKAVEYMLAHDNSKILIVSLTEDQAKLIISMILSYAESRCKSFIARGKHKPTLTKVTFKNGSVALARPVGSTGDAVRGFTGDVLIIDEAAKMNEFVFTSARPTLLTTAGKLWIASTPFGKKGFFWDSFLNKSGRYKVFHISSEEVIKNRAISDTWSEQRRAETIKFLADEKASMTELQYGQEYLGLFLEDLRQYFPDELISKCAILKRPVPYPKENNFFGCDIARLGGDESTIEVLHVRAAGQMIHHIESIVRTRQLTTTTEQNILDYAEFFSPLKIGIDAGSGSLGVGIFDRLLANPKTKRKVVAMNNRQISMDRENKTKQRIFKEDMYANLLSMMEKGEILLLDDDEVFRSLKSVQWELKTRDGVTRVLIHGEYTHIVEGLIRAAWLCKKEKLNNLRFSYI